MKAAAQTSLVLLALLGISSSASAQGDAFSYQGRLDQNGSPANGLYDMRFTVWNSVFGPGIVAGPIVRTNIVASNGVFGVSLNFGPNVFTGALRWLEIDVRTNVTGAYETLSPRQELLPTPYAMHAATAGSVTPGSVVKSLNNLTDNITLAPGPNVTITPNGNMLTLSAAGAGGSGIWNVNNNNAYYTAGNVGIGTATPQGLLDLNTGTADLSALFVRADPGSYGRGGLIHHQSATYGWQELAQNTGSTTDGYLAYHYVNRSAPGTKIALDVLALRANGNVGIGTTAPGGKLEVVSGSGDLVRLVGYEPFLTFYDSNHGWARSTIQGVDGEMNLFTEAYLRGDNPSGYIHLDKTGKVGLGSATPASKLDIVGQDALSMFGYQPFLTLWDSNAGYARSRIQGVGGEIVLEPESYINGSNPNAAVVIANSGNVSVATLTIRGGADLAEPFEMSSANIPRGAVVVIDSTNPGRLKMSDTAYDKRVAGIVSGAKGIKPGIALYQEGAIEGGENVALTGRVYVQADATNGAIEPGDLLTTSTTPGHAMKAADHSKAQGAVLGKAMSALSHGRGMVLVLVTLQ